VTPPSAAVDVDALAAEIDDRLAARVRREVRTKLATGRKQPPAGSAVANSRMTWS
jgi:hypothetical protein